MTASLHNIGLSIGSTLWITGPLHGTANSRLPIIEAGLAHFHKRRGSADSFLLGGWWLAEHVVDQQGLADPNRDRGPYGTAYEIDRLNRIGIDKVEIFNPDFRKNL
jgi:hypothetical protein